MKRTLALLSLLALLTPGIAFAQTAQPASTPAGPSQQGPQRPHLNATQRQALMQSMRQLHKQLKQLENQAHSQALAALSPAHRALLINLLGQAAIAEKPDRKALAAKLDATLSTGEKAAILNIAKSTRAKARALTQSAHKQMMSQLPADMQQRMAQRMAQMKQGAKKHGKRTPDAGRALLALVTHHPHRGMMEGRGRPGFGHPGMGPGGPGAPGAWRPHRGAPGGPPPPPPTPGTN